MCFLAMAIYVRVHSFVVTVREAERISPHLHPADRAWGPWNGVAARTVLQMGEAVQKGGLRGRRHGFRGSSISQK
jgi:hypothetical protein